MKEILKEKKKKTKPGSSSKVSLSLHQYYHHFKTAILNDSYMWQAGIPFKLNCQNFWWFFPILSILGQHFPVILSDNSDPFLFHPDGDAGTCCDPSTRHKHFALRKKIEPSLQWRNSVTSPFTCTGTCKTLWKLAHQNKHNMMDFKISSF